MGVVETASKCIGRIKYVFGENKINDDGSGVADCSSFTQWVFQQNGINIGRNTESQMNHGIPIEKEQLQAGDLVFFKDTYASNYKDGVSHVAIYAGNGEMIHNSSGGGGVIKSKLNSAYYQSHYLTARRLSGADSDTLDYSQIQNTEVKDLKLWGDVTVVVLTTLVGVGAVFFFIKAFNLKLPSKLSPIKGVI